ncbi:hypothetical protein Ae201684_011505 [Aphanomyces euteiches]|uniref:Uncharacterized protein n=1 Tax=Aphanomyces euteiches TaxID=100861 RepID=A0A6G0WUV6_9STRA|nr:hypothetical protein Ae201684_011505 [Aphanomyces euteiches]
MDDHMGLCRTTRQDLSRWQNERLERFVARVRKGAAQHAKIESLDHPKANSSTVPRSTSLATQLRSSWTLHNTHGHLSVKNPEFSMDPRQSFVPRFETTIVAGHARSTPIQGKVSHGQESARLVHLVILGKLKPSVSEGRPHWPMELAQNIHWHYKYMCELFIIRVERCIDFKKHGCRAASERWKRVGVYIPSFAMSRPSCQQSQNVNNFLSERSSTRLAKPPGGGSTVGSLIFGGGDTTTATDDRKTRRGLGSRPEQSSGSQVFHQQDSGSSTALVKGNKETEKYQLQQQQYLQQQMDRRATSNNQTSSDIFLRNAPAGIAGERRTKRMYNNNQSDFKLS